MFIEGERKRKRTEYRIVKIYRYEEYGTHGTYSAARTQEAQCGPGPNPSIQSTNPLQSSTALLANVTKDNPDFKERRAELERAMARFRKSTLAAGTSQTMVDMGLLALVALLAPPEGQSGSAASKVEEAQLSYARALQRRGKSGSLGASAAVLSAARASREIRQSLSSLGTKKLLWS
jgi:hypothetical protein